MGSGDRMGLGGKGLGYIFSGDRMGLGGKGLGYIFSGDKMPAKVAGAELLKSAQT